MSANECVYRVRYIFNLFGYFVPLLDAVYRSAGDDDRASVASVLLDYCCQGVVESLRDDFSHPGDVRSLDNYMTCCRNVQLQLQQKFRHFIFISGEMLYSTFLYFIRLICCQWSIPVAVSDFQLSFLSSVINVVL